MEASLKTLRLPVQLGSPLYTEMLVKKHQGNQSDLPNGRTLFITRVDSRFTESQLKSIFSEFGPVIKVVLKVTTKPAALDSLKEDGITEKTSLGHVVFEKSEALNEILNIAGTGLIASKGVATLRRKTVEEMIPAPFYYAEPTLLKQALDEFIVEYDVEKEKERQEEAMEPEEDEDGFVRVKNYSAPNRGMPTRVELGMPLAVQESDDMKRRKKKEEKKKRSAEGLDFYKFQLKERTQEQVAAARKQKEDDSKVVFELAKRKKFVQE